MLDLAPLAIAPSLEEQVAALQAAVLDLALWGCGLAGLVEQMWVLGTVTERQMRELVWKCRITEAEAAVIMLAPRTELPLFVPVARDEIIAVDTGLPVADMATPVQA